MTLFEYTGNLHVHTSYSDGVAPHARVARAATEAGVDFVIVTDHNVWVSGCEGYYDGVLLLVGEEVHDVRRLPQANHLLVFGAEAEVVLHASSPQGLIDEVNRLGGFCFLAHPFERGGLDGLEPIPWEDWDVSGYVGLEVWNYMSEFKALSRSRLRAVYYAYFPERGIRGPFRETLSRWDRLLAAGQRVSAIGGSDAHGRTYSMGPLNRVLFPYEHLFRCVNTHVLTERPLNGVLAHDRPLIYDALRAGRTWVGYDLLFPTTGFRFQARSGANSALMGGELVRAGAAVLEVHVPARADVRLLCEGRVVARAVANTLKHTTVETGAYRVEVLARYRRGLRGWIFSNPIYVR
jgi:hypothetical protein